MSDLDLRERQELCDLFDQLGPDAPTLCEGWTTADLAAHLVIREHDPLAAPGLLLEGRLGPVGDKLAEVTRSHMEREVQRGYDTVVERVRTGPPPPLRFAPIRARMNFSEFLIHHEDVRRANGQPPRTDRPDLDAQVWKLLKPMARLLLRKAKPVGVVLRTDEGQESTATKGAHQVVVSGGAVELLLFCYGRPSEVTLEGSDEAVSALRATSLGI